ncbi:MAG: nicotinate-nucleotide adenylyltransferase [bacterium]
MIEIGVLGGTFDPIHYGHLLAAEMAREELGLKKVIFVPAASPPHKAEPEAASQDRYRMVDIAIKDNPYFFISDREMVRGGKSYSKDTLEEFKLEWGPASRLFLILGADAALDLSTWKEIEDIPKLCQFVVINRPNFTLKVDKSYLPYTRFLEIPGLDISSTEIRNRIKQGRSIKYLVPAGVEEYIMTHKLYHRQ